MKPLQIVGIVLIAAGLLAVVYRGFSYTKDTHSADLGPVELRVEERQSVPVPLWAGIVAIAAGAGLLVVAARRKT
jgi:hypothetical protein